MTKFQVLVVDDEPLAREVAVSLLRRDSEVASVVECGDGLRARQMIEDSRPDIVFLDIEMPGLDGMQLAEHLSERRTSRRVHHGIQSVCGRCVRSGCDRLRAQAIFGRAVSSRRSGARSVACASVVSASWRIRWRAWLPNSSTRSRVSRRPPARQYLQRLSIKQGDRTVVLRTEEIVWIEAQDYCVTVHSTRGNHLVRASLTSLEGRLAPETFVRTHRMAIVNVMHVREAHGSRRTSTRVVRRHAGGCEPLAQVACRVVVGTQAAVNGATAAANGNGVPVTANMFEDGPRPVIIASLEVVCAAVESFARCQSGRVDLCHDRVGRRHWHAWRGRGRTGQ